MILYILIGVAILAAVIIAAVAIGQTRFIAFWIALPAQVRTVINVCVGAAITAGVTLGVQSLTTANIPDWLKVILVGVSTAFVRAMNPADAAYGNVADSLQPVGRHEADPVPVDPPIVSSGGADFPPAAGE